MMKAEIHRKSVDEKYRHGLDNRGSDRVSGAALVCKPPGRCQLADHTNGHIRGSAFIGGFSCFGSAWKKSDKITVGLVGTLPLSIILEATGQRRFNFHGAVQVRLS
jgi:hypothetical protein